MLYAVDCSRNGVHGIARLLTKNHDVTKGPFIFYEGGGAGGIWEAAFKNRMTPPSAYQFFHMAPPYSGHFLG